MKGAIVVLGLIVAGCATQQQQPITWVRVDGKPVVREHLQQVGVQCQAEALAASTRQGALDDPYKAYAQVPAVDFSPLGDIGNTIARNRQRNSMVEAAMLGCMARNGYITR